MTPALLSLLYSFLLCAQLSSAEAEQSVSNAESSIEMTVATPSLGFQLRHVHALLPDGSYSLFKDVPSHHQGSYPPCSSSERMSKTERMLHTIPMMVPKPHFIHPSSDNRRKAFDIERWESKSVLAPNVSDRWTLYELAKMCNNAYHEPHDDKWYDLGGRYHVRLPSPSPASSENSHSNFLALPIRLGTRRLRIQRPRLHNTGQLNSNPHH